MKIFESFNFQEEAGLTERDGRFLIESDFDSIRMFIVSFSEIIILVIT